MNNINVFLKQTWEDYFYLHTKHEIMEGLTFTRFTIFIDIYYALLAYQASYYNEQGDPSEIDCDPEKGLFLLFNLAYEEVVASRKNANKSSTYYDVITEMERRFLEYALERDFREDIDFTIMYVPLDVASNPLVKVANPLGITAELLIQAREMILRN